MDQLDEFYEYLIEREKFLQDRLSVVLGTKDHNYVTGQLKEIQVSLIKVRKLHKVKIAELTRKQKAQLIISYFKEQQKKLDITFYYPIEMMIEQMLEETGLFDEEKSIG